MQWNRVKRRGVKLPSSDYELSGSPHDGYQSILTSSETDSQSSISYRCRASFVLDVNQVVSEFSESLIAIVGKYNICYLSPVYCGINVSLIQGLQPQ